MYNTYKSMKLSMYNKIIKSDKFKAKWITVSLITIIKFNAINFNFAI